MPYKLKLIMEDGTTVESPYIVPDNPKSKFGMNDRKIERNIKRVGKTITKRFEDVKDWECVHE